VEVVITLILAAGAIALVVWYFSDPERRRRVTVAIQAQVDQAKAAQEAARQEAARFAKEAGKRVHASAATTWAIYENKLALMSGRKPLRAIDLTEIQSVSTDDDVRSRFTATRILTLGVFALAAKKHEGNHYVFVETSDDVVTIEFEAKKKRDAILFTNALKGAVKRATGREVTAIKSPDDD